MNRAGVDRGEVDVHFVDVDNHRRYLDPVAYAHLHSALIALQDPVFRTVPEEHRLAYERLIYSAWAKGSSVPMPLPQIEVQRPRSSRQTARALTLLICVAMIGAVLGALHFPFLVIAPLWVGGIMLLAWA